MTEVGIWSISELGPQRIMSSRIDLERQLEDWIEQDTGLLEAGLTIIGRQVRVDGGPLDLLAIDAQGTLVVIELKRGTLYRETLAQALDYAASIATMPSDRLSAIAGDYLAKHAKAIPQSLAAVIGNGEPNDTSTYRDVRIVLVGTEQDPGLTRLTTYLANAHRIPTTIVTFQVFELENDQRILLRELTEADTAAPIREAKPRATVEAVCQLADDYGVGESFRRILTTARELNLYPRPYRLSIMYAPMANKSRALFTVWPSDEKEGMLRMWFEADAFPDFFPLSPTDVREQLGDSGWRTLSPEDVESFVQRLRGLFVQDEAQSQQFA